jgi:phosphate acetyltransferase
MPLREGWLDVLEGLFRKARARRRTLVLPEGGEPRIRDAAELIAGERLARVLLIGGEAPGCETVEPPDGDMRDRLSGIIARQRPRMTQPMAARLLDRPACLAGALVAAGEADAMVTGAATPTRRVIEAGLLTVGLEPGVQTPSSFFLMLLPDRALIFADCALTVAPTAAQLADIAISSAHSGTALLGEARTALLSFSTHGSGAGPEVDRVREAVAIARDHAPELSIDGPLQADAALDVIVAQRKGAGGPVAGQANVLVFPTLDAGNIGYKLVERLAGARAIGPVLQGFARPISDLSRGASVDDIVATCVLTLAMSAR